MTGCEWDECQDDATHTVVIVPAGGSEETWKVCRPHDRQLKLAFSSSVPRLALPPQTVASSWCSDCGQALADPTPPCPVCGSLDRQIFDGETLTGHEAARMRSKHPGKGGWMVDAKVGDSLSGSLDAWGHRELVRDRGHDRYREVIVLYQGSRLVSTARLSDHH